MERKPNDQERATNRADYVWLLALSVGVAVGAGIGAAIGSIGAGIGIGTGAGVAVGLILYRRFKDNPGDD